MADPENTRLAELDDTGLIIYNAKTDQPVIDWEAALAFYLLGVVTGSCVVFAIFSWLGLLE